MPDAPKGVEALFGLADKVAIVTGAAGGIGRGIARTFLEAGARVALADRDGARLEEVARELEAEADPRAILRVEFDQSEPESIEAMVAQVEKTLGPIDVMVNNAAAFGFGSVCDLDQAEWDRIANVNLRGVAFCCKSALRRMTARASGRIVNISSIAATRFVLHDNFTYGTTKAGVIALTRNLAREFAHQAIRINCVVPGAIDIPAPAVEATLQPLRGPMMQEGFIPAGGPGEPVDIAAACLFLASNASRYITGQVIAVDGGISAS